MISDRSNTRRGPPPPTFHTTTPRPVGTIGDCFNTAPLESFWGSMQIELLDRRKWMTYVPTVHRDGWLHRCYNPRRPGSSLDYHTPERV